MTPGPLGEPVSEAESDELERHLVEARILDMQATICVQYRFCSECQQMLDGWPDFMSQAIGQRHNVRQYHTISMEAAARSGCQFCVYVWQCLRDSEVMDLYRQIESRLETLSARSTSFLSIGGCGSQAWPSLNITLPGLDYPRMEFLHINVEIRGCAPDTGFNSDAIDPNTSLLEMVHGWTKTCDNNHEWCVERLGTSLPTRLVSIHDKIIRLELIESRQSAPPYATLSYCWGAADFIRTLTSSLEELFHGVPHERLPQTFRDAIQITKALEINYIWIDSLCIIQDSDADWRQESSRMSDVYGNSYINIAASSATDPSEGCFLKPQYMRDALDAEICISGQRYSCAFYHIESVYTSAVEYSHLMTRAWALQEKLLPSRTIYFGNRGAFWDCRLCVGLEDLQGLRLADVDVSHMTTLTSDLPEATKLELSERWERVVYHYSRANLTVSRDKLPGLGGTAKLFGKHKRCEYLAGMWKDETFDVHLCWCIFELRPRPTWRAPTWSWASVDGFTSFHAYETVEMTIPRILCARTLEASVTRVSDAEFGEVSDGWVRITCSYVLRGEVGKIGKWSTLVFHLEGLSCHPLVFQPDSVEDTNVEEDEIVYVLPFTATSLDTVQLGLPVAREDVRGCVLRRTCRALGEFRRIGFFRCGTTTIDSQGVHQSVEGRTIWNQFISLLQEQGAVTAKEVCVEMIDDTEHGTDGFVITIV